MKHGTLGHRESDKPGLSEHTGVLDREAPTSKRQCRWWEYVTKLTAITLSAFMVSTAPVSLVFAEETAETPQITENEKHMEKLNKDLEQIREKAKPAEESAPEMHMDQSVSEEPHDAADSGHPEGMTGEKRPEGKEERGPEGGMSPQP